MSIQPKNTVVEATSTQSDQPFTVFLSTDDITMPTKNGRLYISH